MKTWITGLLGPLLLCACASSSPPPAPLAWDPQVAQGALANGLQYRLVREASEPGRVDVRLTVKAGSVDETDAQVGVAHLLEHLVFYSRAGQPGTVRERMQALGWEQGRHFNAKTNYERTQYLLSPTRGAAQLPEALQVLADLAFATDFNAADLAHERPIVTEEWRGGLGVAQRMNQQRTASQRVGSRYPSHRTIGNERAIAEAQLPALQAFQQRWYQPQNMVLTIVGDIDPQALMPTLQHTLGAHPSVPLPARDYRDLPLDRQLKIFHLQDRQSGSSQVALLFRLHEPASRTPGVDGLRERIVDRLTLAALVSQLQRQPKPNGVRSLTAQKTAIGDYSTVVGIAAGVDGTHHREALAQLLEEIERARRYGLQAVDIDDEREQIRGVAQRMLAQTGSRSFQQWINDLNDAAVQDKVVSSRHTIASAYLQVLDSVSQDEVNQRLRTWTDSTDQVLQLSAPGLTALQVPSPEEVARLRARLQGQSITAALPATTPQVSAPAALPPLPAAAPAGVILQRRQFPREHVQQWQLSNGDRLVWLKRNGAQGQYVLKASSSAGYSIQGIPAWRAQMSAQLARDSAPPGWSAEALQQWRQTHKAALSMEQQTQRLTWSVQAQATEAGTDALKNLLQSYRLSQNTQHIDPQLFDSARDDLLSRLQRQRDDVGGLKAERLQALRQGQGQTLMPTQEDLDALSLADLDADWQQLSRAPTTYYLMADIDVQALEPLVRSELASIPRGPALLSETHLQQPGQRQASLAIALEPRATLTMERYSEQPWSPADAAAVSLLREVANQHLKTALRTDAGGIYRLDFAAELNPDSQRIESRLSFTCDPARLDELEQLATLTLAQLPRQLDRTQLERLRLQLEKKEQLRRTDPDTQLRRLMLSDRRWSDPRYLSEQQALGAALDLPRLQRLAQRLAAAHNSVHLRVLPAPATAVQP